MISRRGSDDLGSLQLLGAGKIEAPHTITQMIERNFDRQKPQEQTVLEAASVAGAEFSAAAVAAALQQEIGEVESCCVRLAGHEEFVAPRRAITWPDGTVAAIHRLGVEGEITGLNFVHLLGVCNIAPAFTGVPWFWWRSRNPVHPRHA
jgi:hypothetical protein